MRESKRKIAIVGTAPSSDRLAPYTDPDWEFWHMGPALLHAAPPFVWHRWFELHPVAEFDPDLTTNDPGYFAWLAALDGTRPVYMRPPVDPRIRAAEPFPWDTILARHGGYFLDSTVAWMMAFVHDEFEIDELGLWGVDFASNTERAQQRKGCFHFIYLMRMKGVTVTIPPQSDMNFEPAPYPDESRLRSKLRARSAELAAQHKKIDDLTATLKDQFYAKQVDRARLEGAIDTHKWIEDIV